MTPGEGFVYAAARDGSEDVGLPHSVVIKGHGPDVLLLEGDVVDLLPLVAAALRDRRITSAAAVAAPLPNDRLWWSFEWLDALVVDRQLAEETLGPMDAWRENPSNHPELRVFHLRVDEASTDDDPSRLQQVEMVVEFRESLHSDRPTAIEVPMSNGRVADEDFAGLFDELADSRVGGAVALLMLSGATHASSGVRLRNPAGLNLEWIDDERSISRQQQFGAVVVRAIGISNSTFLRATGFQQPGELLRMRSDLPGPWSFAVMLEADAHIDPELFVPIGEVFEQSTVNGTQTLAASASASTVVTPGRLGHLVLPMWCLNRSLSPPDGESMRPTPLRARYTGAESQRDVWADREAVIAR